MSEIAEYLMTHYYSKYTGPRTDVVPPADILERCLDNHKDKLVVIRDENIKGVGIYVTLSDETCELLREMDVTRVDVLTRLLQDHGPNVHFILLAADGMKTILMGIQEVKRRLDPKTISWWDPDLKRLHKYILKQGE